MLLLLLRLKQKEINIGSHNKRFSKSRKKYAKKRKNNKFFSSLIFLLLAFVIKKRANFIKYFIKSIGQMFYYDYHEIEIKTIPKTIITKQNRSRCKVNKNNFSTVLPYKENKKLLLFSINYSVCQCRRTLVGSVLDC